MKILFIGGTGIISSACSAHAVELGHELFLLNRGKSSRPAPEGAHILNGDIRDPTSVERALKGHAFDSVVNWIAFTPEHVESDLGHFRGKTAQYVFISSASAYQKPVGSLPITESTPLVNPHWAYSRAKIACEDRLLRAAREENFPITIVRPSHTYDRTLIPEESGWTTIDRMRRGKEIIVHGDGTTTWVLTHHRDFAKGFVGLLGNPRAVGDAFHITSDEALTWNQIVGILADAAGTSPRIVHLPSDFIAAHDARWGASLLGDKAHSVLFDNAKIKRAVPGYVAGIPFYLGAREIIAWHDADPARRNVNAERDALIDKMIASYRSILPPPGL